MEDKSLHTLNCDLCDCGVCRPGAERQDMSSCRCGRDFSIDAQPLPSDATTTGESDSLAAPRQTLCCNAQ